MDRSSWGFGAKSRLEAPGARSGAAKWTGGFDAAVGWGAPRDGAVVDVRQGLLGCESCACRRVSARRPRQARPGRPSRSVLGQARASSIGWQPLTAYTWDVFALGGGGVVAHACIGALVARASASCGGSCDQGGRLDLSCEPRVEICSVFRRRWASCRWIFQPVARAADACSRWVRWSRARHGPALGGAVARLTCACTGQDGRVLDVCLC